jgi:hypothetical protein
MPFKFNGRDTACKYTSIEVLTLPRTPYPWYLEFRRYSAVTPSAREDIQVSYRRVSSSVFIPSTTPLAAPYAAVIYYGYPVVGRVTSYGYGDRVVYLRWHAARCNPFGVDYSKVTAVVFRLLVHCTGGVCNFTMGAPPPCPTCYHSTAQVVGACKDENCEMTISVPIDVFSDSSKYYTLGIQAVTGVPQYYFNCSLQEVVMRPEAVAGDNKTVIIASSVTAVTAIWLAIAAYVLWRKYGTRRICTCARAYLSLDALTSPSEGTTPSTNNNAPGSGGYWFQPQPNKRLVAYFGATIVGDTVVMVPNAQSVPAAAIPLPSPPSAPMAVDSDVPPSAVPAEMVAGNLHNMDAFPVARWSTTSDIPAAAHFPAPAMGVEAAPSAPEATAAHMAAQASHLLRGGFAETDVGLLVDSEDPEAHPAPARGRNRRASAQMTEPEEPVSFREDDSAPTL